MVSAIHNGWSWDRANARLDFYYRGTRIGHIKSGEMTLANGGDFITTTGNVFLGNPGAFATTQPQAAVVMGGSSLSGIAPAGAIATAGGVFASDTVVRKIIAAGTVSNVETVLAVGFGLAASLFALVAAYGLVQTGSTLT